MARTARLWLSQENGSIHIISRISKEKRFFSIVEKEYFLNLMERLAQGFFIRIHSFAIMGNHFHILASDMGRQAQHASKTELLQRYKWIFGNDAEPPEGRYEGNGEIIPDEDGGIQRLRDRLGSVSRFVQELKQSFTRWYNKKNDRKGYLWDARYKSVIAFNGLPQYITSSYIDLNPVRAGIARVPEDYRWSSLGLRARAPLRAESLLWPLTFVDALERFENPNRLPFIRVTKETFGLEWYRTFVYIAGGVKVDGKFHLPKEIVDEIISCNGFLGLTGRLGYKIKNFSEGLAIGGFSAIVKVQLAGKRKYIRPRSFIDGCWAYATRVFRV